MNIKQILYQKYITHKYKVQFGNNCIINRKNIYEGHNAIFYNTRLSNSYLGYGSYIATNSNIKFTKIGKFCSIGDYVRTYLGIHPTKTFVSIHPAFYSTKKQAGFTFAEDDKFSEHKFIENSKYVVEIGNDVWIGNNVNILDGIKIGNGAIIAAGSFVNSDVPDYAIITGSPANVVKYRFEEEQIKFLIDFKWWNKDMNWLKNNANTFIDIVDFIRRNELQ
jgi:acetyltransferase-like isoleucine patch superfamily enzyme